MKKYFFIFVIITIIILLICFISFSNNETNEDQKLLYQDVTINTDGSLKVKEVLWLDGNYNGANRRLIFKKNYAYKFTGIYSNFSGDTDIYDATGISDLKVFDISQSNFNSFDDINNIEKEFKKVEKASKGDYGVYTIDENYSNWNISIYCPAKKEKLFYIEYTINDAIVVHNDIAELYWCFVENNSAENILDYKLIIHLPQEDNNLMVWSHGSLSRNSNIIDNKTVSLEDSSIEPNEFETIRIMFDKTLVPQARKLSNVNGKENIIKYETEVSKDEYSVEEKLNIENSISDILVKLEQKQSIYYYNLANKIVNKITWDNTIKKEYQERIDYYKEIINQNWKDSIENKYNSIIGNNIYSQSNIDYLRQEIDEGFDNDFKSEYYAKCDELQKNLDEKNIKNKQVILKIVFIGYFILGSICVLKIIKLFFERHNYYKKYYRDFPSDDKAYIVDYLLHKKTTSKTFLVTILDLIASKKILLEKSPDIENDYILILNDKKTSLPNTGAEKFVINILFYIIGSNKKCSMNKLINFNVNDLNSYNLYKNLISFNNWVKAEIDTKEYFKKSDKLNKILKLVVICFTFISIILGFFINGNGYINILTYYLGVILLSFIYIYILSLDKDRTRKGIIEYSKWLAHKRFLKDFGTFDEKDFPEIILWEKYYVTAVVLGCSNKVLEKIKIKLVDNHTFDQSTSLLNQYVLYQNTKTFENAFNTLIYNTTKHYKSYNRRNNFSNSSSNNNSSYSGGNSSGGTGGGGGGWSRF